MLGGYKMNDLLFNGFLNMLNNYEYRKVDRFNGDNFTIDTCAVFDSDQPYETGIKHPLYNDGKWVIVEMYENKEAAQEGHNRWVTIMTSGNLPSELKDVSTCYIKKFIAFLDQQNISR